MEQTFFFCFVGDSYSQIDWMVFFFHFSSIHIFDRNMMNFDLHKSQIIGYFTFITIRVSVKSSM